MRAALVFLSLVACGQQDSATKWKAAYSIAECKKLTERGAFLRRCFRDGKIEEESYVGDLECLPYSSPEQLAGVWVVDFEHSAFYPNASNYNETVSRTDRIWLRAEPSLSPEITAAGQGAGRRAYAVAIIGRRSLCDFAYGHMGVDRREVIAKRIIAMRPLPVPKR